MDGIACMLFSYCRAVKSKAGTGCNQAIMLVTDGVPYKYETIFQVRFIVYFSPYFSPNMNICQLILTMFIPTVTLTNR